VRKGGAFVTGRLSTASLQRMLAKRAEEARIAPFTWHDMRRTAAGDLLDVGTDIVTVQHLLGHANPKTTSRYDRRPEEAKRQAVAKLHVPYRRPKTRPGSTRSLTTPRLDPVCSVHGCRGRQVGDKGAFRRF
jgi:hypothetical protein